MKKYINYIPTILALGIITYLSLMRESSIDLPRIDLPHFDKVVHCGMYLFASFVFISDSHRTGLSLSLRYILLTSIALYGGAIELLQQYYFPPRTGEWFDWIADIVGVLLAIVIGKKIVRWL